MALKSHGNITMRFFLQKNIIYVIIQIVFWKGEYGINSKIPYESKKWIE